MPSLPAASRALPASREAIARICETSPRCIAGMTFSTAMLATPRTPQFTLRNAEPSPYEVFFRRSGLRAGRAAFGLAREHPTRILGFQRAGRVEPGDLVRGQRQLGGGDVVVKLLDRLRADDHAHDALALQQPGERDACDRGVMRLADLRHDVDDVVGAFLVDRREVEDRTAGFVVAAFVTAEFARQE